ncbi:MAG: hypothetical protein L0241_04540 [Planctomycetia bacterium]|nr:hypothetical protein [Planctomycetia bacterium]
MHTPLIILVWLLNLGISIWNAYAVGLAWVEAKHAGGWPRIVAWAGAAMSAMGFSWCYLLILTYGAYGLDWLDLEHVGVALQMGYVLLVPGVLAAGMVITLDSWARAYRVRTLANIGRAAWNSYVQIHNTFHAIRDFDKAFGSVLDTANSNSSSFSSGDSGKKSTGVVFIIVFVIAVLALLSGILTTAVIIYRVAGNTDIESSASASVSENQKPDK